MMRMLNWFDREDISSPRTQMFNVFFNICNYPKIDTSETPPFHPKQNGDRGPHPRSNRPNISPTRHLPHDHPAHRQPDQR